MENLVDLGLDSAPAGHNLWVDSEQASGYLAAKVHFPDRYDHYEILTRPDDSPWELGRGAMGVTYKAFDANLQCVVALKLINSQSLAGRNAKERFQLEARTAAKLRHPNIASVFHLGARDDVCFYSMEFIEGESLGERVEREGAFHWRDALGILVQVARALEAAHAQNCIHRDIKPSNIMLSEDRAEGGHRVAKLIDFGLATRGGLTADSVVTAEWYFAGTPRFASPEQLTTGSTGPRSDIYSLGATLLYMLMGSEATVSAPQEHLLSSLPRGMPRAFVKLVRSMIAVDPSQRPQSATEVLQRCSLCRGSTFAGVEFATAKVVSYACIGVAITLGGIAWYMHTRSGLRDSLQYPKGTPISKNMNALMAQVRGREHYEKITREDNHRAIELYTTAIDLDPQYALAHAMLAEAYCQGVRRSWLPEQWMGSALKSAMHATALDPGGAESHFALGMVYAMQELKWESLGQIYRSLEIDPTYDLAMRTFGLLWILVGQPQKGLPWLKAAAASDPSNTKALCSIGDAYKDLGADELAVKNYEKALSIDPVRLDAFYGLIHLEILRGHFDAAQELCAKVMALRPDDIFGKKLAAQIAMCRCDWTTAERLYRLLLKENSTGDLTFYGSVRYTSALAFILGKLGKNNEAEQFARQSEVADRQMSESGPQAWFDLAALQAGRGEVDLAAKSFKQAVKEGWLDYRAAYVDPRFSELRSNRLFQDTVVQLQTSIGKSLIEAKKMCDHPLQLAEYRVTPPTK